MEHQTPDPQVSPGLQASHQAGLALPRSWQVSEGSFLLFFSSQWFQSLSLSAHTQSSL